MGTQRGGLSRAVTWSALCFRKKENSGCSVKDGLEVGNLELGRSLRLAVIQVREGTQESPGNCPGSTPDHLNKNIWRWDPDISSFKLP